MQTRLERMWGQIRSWREDDPIATLRLNPNLGKSDIAKLRKILDDAIEGRGGELAARKRASEVGACFLDLSSEGRRRFFELLAEEYDHDDDAVDAAMAQVQAAPEGQRAEAEAKLRNVLRPRRERLFRRFVGLQGGLPFLVDLREELLPLRRESPALASLDQDLRITLARFFDVGLLRLERLTWDSPAVVLEKLIEYEAVHEIKGWADLRGRLDRGRRCYAFFHPAMANDPLIFVEVAFTTGIPDALEPLLDHSIDKSDPTEADSATFYSISNCYYGLTGVSLGDLLIKSVVEELARDLPNLQNFVTLSPIPGLRKWVQENATDVRSLIPSGLPSSAEELADLKPKLEQLAARYLAIESGTEENGTSRALDPVANFHLSNGAQIYRLNWWANPTETGWDRSMGIMVNYRYEPAFIGDRHDAYAATGERSISDMVKKLLPSG